MADPRRLLVLAPNWLGDAVMALPAIDDLRRRHPGAALVVAARRPVAQLFTMVPEVTAVVELEWSGSVGQTPALLKDARRLRRLHADIALLLPNYFASALLVWLPGVPERWGYGRDGRSWLLTRAVSPPPVLRRDVPSRPAARTGRSRVPPDAGGTAVPVGGWPRPVSSMGPHQGEYYQHLVRTFGAANGPLTPRIVVPDTARAAARALLGAHGWNEGTPLVVFAPGAAYGTAKRWWPSHFAAVASALIATRRAVVVLVGSGADAATTTEVRTGVADAARPSVIDLAGRTDLATLAGVLHLANACVSNDSGAMHVAGAVGVPLVALFGPTNEHETAPLAHAPMTLLLHDVPCRPCMLRECPIDHPCMRDLAPSRVVETLRETLAADAPR